MADKNNRRGQTHPSGGKSIIRRVANVSAAVVAALLASAGTTGSGTIDRLMRTATDQVVSASSLVPMRPQVTLTEPLSERASADYAGHYSHTSHGSHTSHASHTSHYSSSR